MSNLYCPTDQAVLLAAIRDPRDVLRFPSTPGAPLPGLYVAVKPLIPIYEQLKDAAGAVIGRDVARELKIWDEFADELPLPDGTKATLYVASLEAGPVQNAGLWQVMPDLLRALPKTRIRLPYLRAWQILQGGLKLNTKAVDPAEVAKYYPEILGEEPEPN